MYRPPAQHTASTLSKSSSLYQSVSTVSPASPPSIDHLPCRRKAKLLQVLLVTLALLLSLILPLALWSWYVFYKERTVFDWSSLAVLTTTNATRFLLLATISTTVTKAVIGPLMAMYAYTASADWLRSCEREQLHRLPSTTQFGSLLSLFQGTSFIGLIGTLRGGFKRGHLAWPPMLKKVVALLAWLLFLAYSLTLVSLWLQIDAEPVTVVPTTTDFPSLGYNSQNTLFGRNINHTLCAAEDARALKGALRTPTCGLVEYLGDAGVARYTSSLASEVLNNDSSIARAAWLDDNIAILAPATAPLIGYRAKAVGVRAACRSVTHLCVSCNGTASDVPLKCEGAGYDPTIECSAAAKLNTTTGFRTFYGPVSPTNGTSVDRWFNANPFAYGNRIKSTGYLNSSLSGDATDHFAGTTGFIVRGTYGGTNLLYCDISVYDTAYQFTPPDKYVRLTATLSNISTADYVGYGLTACSSTAGRGFEAIDGTGQRGNATYPDIFGRQLSKIAISTLTKIVPATPSDLLLAGSGTRVNLIAMLLLFILNGCIIVTTAGIGAHATIVIINAESKFLSAARGRLISAYPLIGDTFGGLAYDYQHHRSAVSAGMDEGAFLPQTEDDRVQLIPEEVDGGPQRGQLTLRLRARTVAP